MSTVPDGEPDDADRDAERQVNAMKDHLRKDVASWSAARSGASARQTAEMSSPAAQQPSLQPAKRTKRVKPAATDPKSPASATKKPFSMSYDGVTQADYINYMIARGTR